MKASDTTLASYLFLFHIYFDMGKLMHLCRRNALTRAQSVRDGREFPKESLSEKLPYRIPAYTSARKCVTLTGSKRYN